LLFQVGGRHSGIADYRFEFNPNKLGTEGMTQVIEFIDDHWDTGFQALFSSGKITRIDLALDVPDLSLDQVIVRSKRSRKHGVYTSSRGAIETTYLGSGARNRTVTYSKSDGENDYLRVERRMKPYCRGSDLTNLKNPFSLVQMVSTHSLIPHLNGMIPQQFFDSVRMRGLNHVLAGISAEQAKAIRAVFGDPNNSALPSLEEVWKNSWPKVLHHHCLGSVIEPMPFPNAAE
jgi:hypothetical protein